MLTSAQVRADLRIGRDKLADLVKSGELEAVKLGTAPNAPYRFSEESLAAYKERHRVVPVEAVS